MQWNISTISKPKAVADLINKRTREGPAIACLEEVKRSSYGKLVDSLKPQSPSLGLNQCEPSKNEGKERGTGIGVLLFRGL
jgi:hypothetical protein